MKYHVTAYISQKTYVICLAGESACLISAKKKKAEKHGSFSCTLSCTRITGSIYLVVLGLNAQQLVTFNI